MIEINDKNKNNKYHKREIKSVVPNPIKETDINKNTKKSKNIFKKLSRKTKILILLILVLLILFSTGIVYVLLLNSKKIQNKPETSSKPLQQISKPEAKKEPVKFYSRLSGVEVQSKELETAPVFGVMIENSIPARPQSGLNQAEVVFEAIAEGGITRFLALYQQNKPELIGPVRSLRGYYIDWATGFNASVAHVGGSGDALARIRDGNHRDMDEFFNTNTFWRSRNRYAPHNVYTNFNNLAKLGSLKGWHSSNFDGFHHKEDTPAKDKNATQIQVNISGAYYNSTYSYQHNCNCYLRNQAGTPHLDSSGAQISPKSIAILKMDNGLASDRYYSFYNNIGAGKGVVFQDGTATEINWEKANEGSPLIIKTNEGKNFEFNKGQTWFAIVGNSTGSVSWQ